MGDGQWQNRLSHSARDSAERLVDRLTGGIPVDVVVPAAAADEAAVVHLEGRRDRKDRA